MDPSVLWTASLPSAVAVLILVVPDHVCQLSAVLWQVQVLGSYLVMVGTTARYCQPHELKSLVPLCHHGCNVSTVPPKIKGVIVCCRPQVGLEAHQAGSGLA